MPHGDIGGAVTELILTCLTPAEGEVAIARGDAVKLTGPYTVTNLMDAEDPVFGQSMAPASANHARIPVKVRGVAIFGYTGTAPAPGAPGVAASAETGKVKAPAEGAGRGIVLRADEAESRVHVLI